ncbi:MAG: hypothetical protein QOJ35_1157 [Solirubrobacteraceae bacterium]|nr:hypothetical protein [Solirubrobacteraceae bacterium]
MDRAKWIGSLVVACALSGAGAAVAQTPAEPPVPALSAALETCETGALPIARVASFVGSMPAVAGADRMQMRFDLQRRRFGGRVWRRVRVVQGFGVWEAALPGRAGFVFHKRVDGLRVPATYRAIVRFRWYGPDGTIVRRARRRTPACSQPDLRPDLAPGPLRASPGLLPGLAVYTLVVRNRGRSPAGPFAVRIAGGVSDLPGLAAGAQAVATVTAAVCLPGSIVDGLIDADQQVVEVDEHNALRRRCPLG